MTTETAEPGGIPMATQKYAERPYIVQHNSPILWGRKSFATQEEALAYAEKVFHQGAEVLVLFMDYEGPGRTVIGTYPWSNER